MYHCRAKISIIERRRNETTMMPARETGKVKTVARRAGPMTAWGVIDMVVDVRMELASLGGETL